MSNGSDDRVARYVPRSGLSIPIVTVLGPDARVLEAEQRAAVRFVIQGGRGADIIFAVGTNGEWDRLDNAGRQQALQIIIDECRRSSPPQRPVEAWAGVTAHTRDDTMANLAYAIEIDADAAVIAPLSIRDVDDPVELLVRDVGKVFECAGRMIPVFLYDNADIAAPGKPPHLHTRDVKRMSELPYVRGIKVTASKAVLGNYTRAASHFKLAHEFAIYAGNANLIFDLFGPPAGIGGMLRHYWNRYLTQRALPFGVVAGPANAMPREWQRAWQACHAHDGALMNRYCGAVNEFLAACAFKRSGGDHIPMIACLKAALAEMGVISSDAVAPETPALAPEERREFARRFGQLRARWASVLEPGWISEYDAAAGRNLARQHG